MGTKNIIKKHGLDFLWTVCIEKSSGKHESLDEHIRQCEQDDETVQKEKITKKFVDKLGEILKKDKDVFFFVHDSQFMFSPVFCVLSDIATPEEHNLLNQTKLAIAKKFKESNFSNEEVRDLFYKLLYSKENKKRLANFDLEIYEIEHYDY